MKPTVAGLYRHREAGAIHGTTSEGVLDHLHRLITVIIQQLRENGNHLTKAISTDAAGSGLLVLVVLAGTGRGSELWLYINLL